MLRLLWCRDSYDAECLVHEFGNFQMNKDLLSKTGRAKKETASLTYQSICKQGVPPLVHVGTAVIDLQVCSGLLASPWIAWCLPVLNHELSQDSRPRQEEWQDLPLLEKILPLRLHWSEPVTPVLATRKAQQVSVWWAARGGRALMAWSCQGEEGCWADSQWSTTCSYGKLTFKWYRLPTRLVFQSILFRAIN